MKKMPEQTVTYVSEKQLCERYGISRSTAKTWAEKAECRIKVNRTVLIDFDKFREFYGID